MGICVGRAMLANASKLTNRRRRLFKAFFLFLVFGLGFFFHFHILCTAITAIAAIAGLFQPFAALTGQVVAAQLSTVPTGLSMHSSALNG